MSDYQIQNKRKEIQKLKENNAKLQKDVADKRSKILRCNEAIKRAKSESTIKNKIREIERYEKNITDYEKKMAANYKKESTLSKQLNDLIVKREKEQQRTFDDTLRQLEQQKERTVASQIASTAINGEENKQWDVFLSHASEDKVDFATPLANELTKRNVKVWYDQFTLDWGDSLMKIINEGIANSKFGIVVLSSSFFKKDWPQQELDALFSKEMLGNKTILPIWHNVSKEEVAKYCPLLLGSLALKTTDYTVSEICDKLELLLDKHEDSK